ncbi:hypothetical protein NEFER03_1113 [Nematocida sp. LUAm3]|nr:hypothetical protein NEFER03_1113 [Nematocida sp. LUAm3]KAI5175758.1 hypothetical protein NEFER02_1627 [Nematocida sp. LUAm2]KAI5178227.1 hypothetical protein NEFER01_1394 [Nematocida sp. LUAm1]
MVQGVLRKKDLSKEKREKRKEKMSLSKYKKTKRNCSDKEKAIRKVREQIEEVLRDKSKSK